MQCSVESLLRIIAIVISGLYLLTCYVPFTTIMLMNNATDGIPYRASFIAKVIFPGIAGLLVIATSALFHEYKLCLMVSMLGTAVDAVANIVWLGLMSAQYSIVSAKSQLLMQLILVYLVSLEFFAIILLACLIALLVIAFTNQKKSEFQKL